MMTEGIYEVSDDVFTAISAVEGIYLSDESKARLNKLSLSDLTPEMKREAVRKAYRPDFKK